MLVKYLSLYHQSIGTSGKLHQFTIDFDFRKYFRIKFEKLKILL